MQICRHKCQKTGSALAFFVKLTAAGKFREQNSKTFCNSNFQLKHPNRLNGISLHKYNLYLKAQNDLGTRVFLLKFSCCVPFEFDTNGNRISMIAKSLERRSWLKNKWWKISNDYIGSNYDYYVSENISYHVVDGYVPRGHLSFSRISLLELKKMLNWHC